MIDTAKENSINVYHKNGHISKFEPRGSIYTFKLTKKYQTLVKKLGKKSIKETQHLITTVIENKKAFTDK